MKKIVALAISLLLCLTFLVACGAPVQPKFLARWNGDSEEVLTYKVALISSAQVDGKYVDDQIYNANLEMDEYLPLSVEGTYVTTLTHEEENSTYKTELNVVYTYNLSVFDGSPEIIDTFVDSDIAIVDQEQGKIYITNSVTTTCTIDTNTLSPISSTSTHKGGYVGKNAKAVNDFVIELTYGKNDDGDYTCTGSLTDNIDSNQNETYQLTFDALAFDNSCLFLAMRCFEATDLAEGTTFSVFAPLVSQEPLSISLTGNTGNQAVITSNISAYSGSFSKYTSAVGATKIVVLADYSQKIAGDGGTEFYPNTPVKLQQGFLVFTLSDADLQTLGYEPLT